MIYDHEEIKKDENKDSRFKGNLQLLLLAAAAPIPIVLLQKRDRESKLKVSLIFIAVQGSVIKEELRTTG